MSKKLIKVKVVWEDASSGSAWTELPVKYNPYICTSIGYLLYSKPKEGVVVGLTLSPNAEYASNILHIPAGMVRKITYVK